MTSTNSEHAYNKTNIGLFTRIPREIRDQFWEEVIPRPRYQSQYGDLSIMRTCKQIYHEISDRLYRRESLYFHVRRPIVALPGDLWGVGVKSSRGKIWYCDDFGSSTLSIIRHFPYHKLLRVEVYIDASPSSDPIQLYAMFKRVTAVVELLSYSSSLQRIDIVLIGGPPHWTRDGVPKKSIPYPFTTADGGQRTFEPDYAIALAPFSRLRGVQNARLHFPQGLQTEETVMRNHLIIMERKSPVEMGSVVDRRIDALIQKRLSGIYLNFEFILDIIPGCTGNFMRLSRFAHWFGNGSGGSTYFEEWARSQRPGDWTKLKDLWQLYKRYQYFLLFNPWAVGTMRMIPVHRYFESELYAYLSRNHTLNGFCDHLDFIILEIQRRVPKPRQTRRDELAPSTQWFARYHGRGIPRLDPNCRYIKMFLYFGRSRDMCQWAAFVKQHLAQQARSEPRCQVEAGAAQGGQVETMPKQQRNPKKRKREGASVEAYSSELRAKFHV